MNLLITTASAQEGVETTAGCTAEYTPQVLLTASQAAAMCGVGRSTWWKLHSAGKVPAPIKLGGATRWRSHELLEWIEVGCPSRDRWGSQR